MKHIRPTSRPQRTPATAASNFVALLRFFLNVNEQIIDFLFKL